MSSIIMLSKHKLLVYNNIKIFQLYFQKVMFYYLQNILPKSIC